MNQYEENLCQNGSYEFDNNILIIKCQILNNNCICQRYCADGLKCVHTSMFLECKIK